MIWGVVSIGKDVDMGRKGRSYSKPMCEWTTRRAQRMESVTGFSEPAAKGATVRGMRPAETILGGDVSRSFRKYT